MSEHKLDPNKLAVIIPAYNAEATIERAVRSALDQTLPVGYQLDVIVVDDCSSDRTAQLVGDMAEAEERLIFLSQVNNGGPSAARNRALAATDAVWFTPLDSDDYMLPGRLNTLLTQALDGGWQMIADNFERAFDDRPSQLLWPSKPDGIWEMDLERFVRRNLKAGGERTELGFIKPVIDRRALTDAQVYREDMRFGEDYDLYTRLLANGARACLVDAAGYIAVQMQGSLSRIQSVNDHALMVTCDQLLLARDDLDRSARRVIHRHMQESQAEWVWLRAIDAVKSRNLAAFLSCFFVSVPASLALMGHLLAQVFIRSGRKLSGQADG